MVVLVWAPRADRDAAPGSGGAGHVSAQTPGTGDCSRASGELSLETGRYSLLSPEAEIICVWMYVMLVV